MTKDTFKSSKARYTGGDTNEQSELLRQEFVPTEADIAYKNHTIRLSDNVLEKIKDYVFFQKCNGSPFYSQGQLIEEALISFFENLEQEIPERPDEIKKKEKRRTGRKVKKRPSVFNTSDFSL